MYVITLENDGSKTVIHEPGTSEVKVEDAKVSREVNKFDSLSFTVYPGNPGYDFIDPFATLVTVDNLKTGKRIFDGRVIQPVPSMDSDGTVCKSVTCESVMGYLCDTMQDWSEERHWSGQAEGQNGLQEFLSALLATHNARCEDGKQIHLGDVTLQTFETSDGVTKGIDRASTWDNISDKLLDVFGGEMRVRRGDDGLLYLDYAEQLGVTRATKIEVARNMASAEREVDPNSVITRLYPYGCKLTVTTTDENGELVDEETEERLTIESVNDGIPYIDDTVAMAAYGIVEGYHEWDDVTLPENLLSKARSWLGQNNAMPVSHTVDAVDLSLLGLDIDSFEIFDSYPCFNPLIGLDEELEIVRQTIDISDPASSSFDLGETSYRLSADIDKGDISDEFYLFQSQTNSNVTNVENRVRTTWAAIQVYADQIRQTVTEQIQDVNEAVTNVTEMVQNWEGWEFNFTEVTQQITDLGTQLGTQLKYIKFIDGEIWLGRDPDPGQDDFKVVISNESVRFLQNNLDVAYINNNQLYITNARILTRLQIGDFAFFPRNNGNMTLRYVG